MDAGVPGEHLGDARRHLHQARGAGCVVEVHVPGLAALHQRHGYTGADKVRQWTPPGGFVQRDLAHGLPPDLCVDALAHPARVNLVQQDPSI